MSKIPGETTNTPSPIGPRRPPGDDEDRLHNAGDEDYDEEPYTPIWFWPLVALVVTLVTLAVVMWI